MSDVDLSKFRAKVAARRAEQAAQAEAKARQEEARQAELAPFRRDGGPVFGLEDMDDCGLTDEERRRRYYATAVAGLINEMQSTHEGFRNHTLNALAYRLGRLSAGLGLPVEPMAVELGKAAMSAGLDKTEVIRTLKSGITKGQKNPWSPA